MLFLKLNKKAQTSLEVLIVFGIFVIGMTLLGLFFLNNIVINKSEETKDTKFLVNDSKQETISTEKENTKISCYYLGVPTITPSGGTYEYPIFIKINYSDPDCKDYIIYYTTNGDTPGSSSNKYTSPIPINKQTTIKAIVIATDSLGSINSGDIVIENYYINMPA